VKGSFLEAKFPKGNMGMMSIKIAKYDGCSSPISAPWYLSVLVHSHIEFVQKKQKTIKKGRPGMH
jgi:hypothetical protein